MIKAIEGVSFDHLAMQLDLKPRVTKDDLSKLKKAALLELRVIKDEGALDYKMENQANVFDKLAKRVHRRGAQSKSYDFRVQQRVEMNTRRASELNAPDSAILSAVDAAAKLYQIDPADIVLADFVRTATTGVALVFNSKDAKGRHAIAFPVT